METKNLFRTIIFFLIVLSVFVVIKIFLDLRLENKGERLVINVSGQGRIFAKPDIANISFSIEKEAKTVTEAQKKVTSIEQKVLSFLRDNNIEEKDIRTYDINISPKYEYITKQICIEKNKKTNDTKAQVEIQTEIKPVNKAEIAIEKAKDDCSQYTTSGKNVLVGYNVAEKMMIKIRNIDNLGTIVGGVSDLEISNLNGPNFSIDNEEKKREEAKEKAIKNAQEKAEMIAKNLNIKLVKIIGFDEGNLPIPYYENNYSLGKSIIGLSERQYEYNAPSIMSQEIPSGENEITSYVTITYEYE